MEWWQATTTIKKRKNRTSNPNKSHTVAAQPSTALTGGKKSKQVLTKVKEGSPRKKRLHTLWENAKEAVMIVVLGRKTAVQTKIQQKIVVKLETDHKGNESPP